MTERDRLIDNLNREIKGQPWHGPSLASILEGVTAAVAARKPSGGAHSIWEIVLHMTGWKREVTRRVHGGPAGQPPEGDWPAVGEQTDRHWREVQADHLRAHDELIAAVRELKDEQLATRVPGNPAASEGAGISFTATLWGLVQHDVYHAGQIAILKKIAGNR
jgi:uncharacterized damage-inducible protein DinB